MNAKDIRAGNKEHRGQSKARNSVWTVFDMLRQIFPRSRQAVVSLEER